MRLFTKASVAIFLVMTAQIAMAENWLLIGVDKDAFGNDARKVEIDLDSVKRSKEEVYVSVRSVGQGFFKIGYSCKEGDIRHGNVEKRVAELICNQPSSKNSNGPHDPSWATVQSRKTKTGEETRQIDVNNLSRFDDTVMVTERQVGTGLSKLHFDCKGYYSTGTGQWNSLDVTDKIPTVPRGFVSLERKISEKVYGTENR